MLNHIRIVGIGSPHGSDQLGWLVASRLAQRPNLGADVVSIAEPTLLWHHLADCQQVIIIDAMVTGTTPGSVLRFEWPDPRVAHCVEHSTHGLGLATMLRLAQQMNRLPESVVLLGLEIGHDPLPAEPLVDLPPEIDGAVAELEKQVLREMVRFTAQ